MDLSFYKYEGAGNDFILLDNREMQLNLDSHPQLINKLCDRRFGIGADGLMGLQFKEGYDFEMLYYNANGSAGTMCGNGGRCIAAFAKQLGLTEGETNFLAVDGPHYAKISESGDWVSLKMIDVNEVSSEGNALILNTGSPHYVIGQNQLMNYDVFKAGQAIRYNEVYSKEGINVNFVEDMGEYYYVRTYERGVEDETYACGTGATAVAMAMAKQKSQTGQIKTLIRVPGGELRVTFHYDGLKFTDVFLEGPARFVFRGSISI